MFICYKFINRLALALILAITALPATAAETTISHGLSVFGDLKYASDFKHFDYVNPNAPKYGNVTIASVGTYDSLNPFILKGVSADGVEMLFDTLMQSSADESYSEYGLIAESVELPKTREWVIFNLRPEAKWQDGSPITADDVVFSFNTIKEKGHPQYKTLYKDVSKAEKLGERKVKFTFSDASNRELPLIAGQLPIISKAYYEAHEFDKTTLEAPLGSGAYKVKSMQPGRSITYERVKNYWADKLPVNVGKHNFDTIKIDYYRDDTVAIEALKAGEYDFRRENIAKNWATNYNLPQVKDGRTVKETLPDGTPTGMQCFAFNTRRANFQNPKVREALNYAYDFEWANKQLFYSAYTRNTSYFGNSEFAWQGLPSADELKLLEPFRDSLPPEVFTKEPEQPTTDGDLTSRTNLLKAQALLEEAGYHLRDMQRINPETNQPMQIEFLLSSASFERVIAPYIRNLKKLGIESTIRTVDSSQYIKKLEDFDFDITLHWFVEGPSPGNEQINYWHSSRADTKGGQNLIGIKNPAVDKMVDKITSATSKQELITATRALDRILLWNYYSIPNWYSRSHRIIYWNKFGRPEITPPFALGFLDTWWVDKDKEAQLMNKKGQ
jgi:microcin C transport system substrate-binding protein